MSQASRLLTLLFWIINLSNGAIQNFRVLKDINFDNVTYMDTLSREAMKGMHDALDNDDDGNVSISEGVEFLAGNKDLMKNTGENANLPGFVTDTDGRITEAEFWESWIKSHVHNWTNTEMLSWLQYDVEMPQYAANFQAFNIRGSAFPILACNSTVVAALVEGSKENKFKLMLKAKEIVLFGPSKHKSSWLKDALLTFSLALALSGIAFGVHVQRTANRTILAIQEKMKSLQTSVDTMEEEDALDWRRGDVTRPDDDGSGGSNSAESEESMITTYSVASDDIFVQGKLAEVMRELDATKEALRNAEKQLQKRKNTLQIPTELINLLKLTYQEETRLLEMKKKQVYDNVDRTKAQFQKIERNRSTFLGILQVVHSRQVDNFDSEVQETREEFRQLQNIIKERRRRWDSIEQLCKIKILPSSVRTSTSSRISSSKPSNLDILESPREQRRNISKSKSPKTRKGRESFELPASDLNRSRSSSVEMKSSPPQIKSTIRSNHSSSPTLTHLNGNCHGSSEKISHSKISHSESAKHLSGNSLLSIPESGNQTFPKRSPQAKRRGVLYDMVDKSNSFGSESSSQEEIRRRESSSSSGSVKPEIKIMTELSLLDASKRSGSCQSLPHIQEAEPSSVQSLVIEKSRLFVESPDILDTQVEGESISQNSPSSSSVESTRKSNLKKRSFFTFKKKKK